MRCLTTRRRGDERGAVIILMVAFSMVLVGMAALVIDVGALHDEKRQLQNGADAGALAVARSCALGPCDASLATSLADANSNDARSNAVVDYPAAKEVRASTSSQTGTTTILPYSFAQILTGRSGQTVSAKATATWGPVGRATAVRLPISQCDFDRLRVSTVESTISFHDPGAPCAPSGKDAPGNFGWLADDGGDPCELTVAAGETPTGATGRTSAPADCLALQLNSEILVPVATPSGSGATATYDIKGFASFHLTAYRFQNKDSGAPAPCSGPVDCIRGYFVRYVEASGVIGGTDFGVSTVKLVS